MLSVANLIDSYFCHQGVEILFFTILYSPLQFHGAFRSHACIGMHKAQGIINNKIATDCFFLRFSDCLNLKIFLDFVIILCLRVNTISIIFRIDNNFLSYKSFLLNT